jgi:hypothetical protein
MERKIFKVSSLCTSSYIRFPISHKALGKCFNFHFFGTAGRLDDWIGISGLWTAFLISLNDRNWFFLHSALAWNLQSGDRLSHGVTYSRRSEGH